MQNDLKLLKKKIYEDQKITCLLEELECQNIHEEQRGNLIVAQLPARFNSDNKRSVQVRNNESLTAHIRSRGIDGDIFSIVGYILYGCQTFEEVVEKLPHIKAWIINALGYEDEFKTISDDFEYKPKVDYNAWLKKIKKKRAKQSLSVSVSNRILDESILNEFIRLPHIRFCQDGISPKTQYEFEIGYDLRTDRIVFPVRNRYGELIGVKGRYVGDNKQIEEDAKYIYIYPCDKSIELYNLHRALPYIKEKNEVIVVEGAKSVMLLHQWGYKNAVSLEGKYLSPVQAMLLKELQVNIVFAWDKDVDLEFIKQQTRQIKNRIVYVVFDSKDLLADHDSPVDKGKEVWDNLYRTCRLRIW